MVDVWTVCWRAPEDKHNDWAMATLNQVKTNANARLTNNAASDAILRGHSVCWNEPTRVLWVWTFRLLDTSCIFRSSETWFEVIIFIKS